MKLTRVAQLLLLLLVAAGGRAGAVWAAAPAATATPAPTPSAAARPSATPCPSCTSCPSGAGIPACPPADRNVGPTPPASPVPSSSPKPTPTPSAAPTGTTAETRSAGPLAVREALALFPAGEEAFPEFEPHPAALTVGERLEYSVSWSGVPAGRATLEVTEAVEREGRRAFRVAYRCSSNKFLSSVYRVRNEAESLIDAAEGYSRLYALTRDEGPFTSTERVELDVENRVAVHEQTGPGGEKVSQLVQLPGKVYDPLACLYAARALALVPGQTVRLTVTADRRNWVLALEVLERETLTVAGLGPRAALKVRPVAAFPGLFVRKGGLVVWLDEATRVPLQMQVEIPIGAVTVTLSSSANSPLNRAE